MNTQNFLFKTNIFATIVALLIMQYWNLFDSPYQALYAIPIFLLIHNLQHILKYCDERIVFYTMMYAIITSLCLFCINPTIPEWNVYLFHIVLWMKIIVPIVLVIAGYIYSALSYKGSIIDTISIVGFNIHTQVLSIMVMNTLYVVLLK